MDTYLWVLFMLVIISIIIQITAVIVKLRVNKNEHENEHLLSQLSSQLKEVLYVGITDCGCCVAVMNVDLSDIERLKDAVEDMKQWQNDGLIVELKDFDYVKKNLTTCKHIKKDDPNGNQRQ